MRVLPRWSSIHAPGADAYIRRAMRNQHASWYRQKWRWQERSFADVPDVTPTGDSHSGSDTALWPLVAALPPAQCQAVALRYYEGLSVEEASNVLGCAPGTVKSNTSRGLASLRRSLSDANTCTTLPA
jgi:RNA polymerase sigma factor (sigma-70 family)